MDRAALDPNLYRLLDLEGDAAQGVDDILHPVEVHDDIVFHREPGEVLEGLQGQLGFSGSESSVDLVLSDAGDLDQRIPRHRDYSPARLRHHDRI
jgi:hypothetical protein